MPAPVLVAGETYADFFPAEAAPLDTAERFSRRPGGAPANVAVGLARLGVTPWFWTRLGTDPFGESLAETLAAEGLPARFVRRDETARTPLTFVGSEGGDGPRFVPYCTATADTRFESGTVPDDVLAAVDWCCVGGVVLAADRSRAAMVDLVRRARERGCQVYFDPNVRPGLWSDEEMDAVLTDFLAHVDLLKATSAELRALGLADGRVPDAERCRAYGIHTVCATHGADGATIRSTSAAPWGATTATHPGYEVSAADPTGAGDGFSAGLLYGLVEGCRDPTELLATANAVGALATTGTGAMAALPGPEAVASLRTDGDA